MQVATPQQQWQQQQRKASDKEDVDELFYDCLPSFNFLDGKGVEVEADDGNGHTSHEVQSSGISTATAFGGAVVELFPSGAVLTQQAEQKLKALEQHRPGVETLRRSHALGVDPLTSRWCRRTLLAHHVQHFLDAENQDPVRASERLAKTLSWRQDNQVEGIICEACCKVS